MNKFEKIRKMAWRNTRTHTEYMVYKRAGNEIGRYIHWSIGSNLGDQIWISIMIRIYDYLEEIINEQVRNNKI